MNTFESEAKFEEAVIKELQRNGWSEQVIKYPTEEDLMQNWANILFRNNSGKDRLNDQPLTSEEMRQIIEQIEDLKSPVALNGFINGRTISITRDNPNDPEHLGKEVSLSIYDRLEIAGGKSHYQIAQQPKFERGKRILPDRRGDLLLLINGMPLIHIELKSSKVPAMQAANQIEKYSHEGIFSRLFSLVQIFVAMNPEEMLYFANPGASGRFNRDYYFHWADFNNEPVNGWKEICSAFLSIPKAHQLIGFYTIADKSDGVLKVLRSYQYYAANAISTRVAKNDWNARVQKGGYIWHTTGSGKTMTSFKAAQLIATSGDADKVVFLVDRIELGCQSLQNYRSFAGDSEEVQDTDDTAILLNKLKDEGAGSTLIVTSIQKMSRVNAEDLAERIGELEQIQRKHIVFIVDECHRSTFGDMLITIKGTFPRALFFGFTGTPIKDENQKNMNTTQTVFGESLHQYLLADGIRDGNVLGFEPKAIETYKAKDLRRAVALEQAKARTEAEALADDKKKTIYLKYTQGNTVPMAGYVGEDGRYVKGIEDFLPESQYNNEKHHLAVVQDIQENWDMLSQCGKFHALLASRSIPEAIAYYRLFRQECPELRVTALFDPSIDNVEGETIKEDGLVEILEGYNALFGVNYTLPTYAQYKVDVSLRLAHKEPYRNIKPEEQLNLLIVVNQMLTGFDSKWINTLYMDKMMEYENIIQAFSRTNRLFGPDKPFGVIRYYRRPHTMQHNIDRAVEVYSDGKPVKLFADPLAHNLKCINDRFTEIQYLFRQAGIPDFAKLPDNEAERGRFAQLFSMLNKYLEAARIQSFRWSKLSYKLKDEDGKTKHIEVLLDELTYLTLVQRYKELQKGGGGGNPSSVDVPYDVDPYITEIDTAIIDADYLNSRFEKYLRILHSGTATAEERASVFEELHRSFASLSQEEQRFAGIFLHEVEQGTVSLEQGKTLKDYIVDYQSKAQNDSIHEVAENLGLEENLLREMLDLHLNQGNINEYNRFTKLIESVDENKAKSFFEQEVGKELSRFKVNKLLDSYLRKFLVEG
ncbi:type I restriction endonuclease subunit R [Porphyromonas endodontalis]|uniref:type I restriction endonuclease subunit R n=1 Tax=Porphyromonas endodontalis TaxID=28124 RepID=UPI00248DEA7C|nr:HsdR family type I site-specific deoxyribonuclease [Porphyromonas endodontalis]